MDQISGTNQPLSVEFRAGGLYDTRVGVEYTGSDNGRDISDKGLALHLNADWRRPVTDDFSFRLGYEGVASIYKDLNKYDVADQTATLEAQWARGRFLFSLPVGYNYVLEDGHYDSYRITLTPTWALLLAENRQALAVYGILAGIRDENRAFPDEDGAGTGVGCAYVFQRPESFRVSLSLAYQVTAYDAAAADYESGTSGESRRDKAAIANTGLYFPLSSRLGLYADYVFMHNNSNVPMYDYNRHIVEGGVAVRIF